MDPKLPVSIPPEASEWDEAPVLTRAVTEVGARLHGTQSDVSELRRRTGVAARALWAVAVLLADLAARAAFEALQRWLAHGF